MVKPKESLFFWRHQILFVQSHWADCMPTKRAQMKLEKEQKIPSIVKDVSTEILIGCWWGCKSYNHLGKHTHSLIQHFQS